MSSLATDANRTARLLLIGLGDLGRRLALELCRRPEICELILAGRRDADGAAFAALVSACGSCAVRFLHLDGLDVDATTAALAREQPDVVVQCASLLSPWTLGAMHGPAAQALQAAGFGLQLPAQLPMIQAVMTAAHAAGYRRPVVNCSYPDVTHPVLARLGLAPTIGIGNAGMIAAAARSTLRTGQAPPPRVRVLAHHSHVTAAMTRARARAVEPGPRVWLGEPGTPADELVYQGPALASSRELNALSAVHGLEIILALLPGGPPLATSAPGPHGLPGGWPVRIGDGRVELDLPTTMSQEVARRACEAAAAGDGIERIDDDGTVHFTATAQRAVSSIDPELAAPLAPAACLPRLALLRHHLGLAEEQA